MKSANEAILFPEILCSQLYTAQLQLDWQPLSPLRNEMARECRRRNIEAVGSELYMQTPTFTKIVLFTDTDGRARFREEVIELTEGQSEFRLSPLLPSSGYLLRESPVGYDYEFHWTKNPIWVIILGGQMEVSLRDGTSRLFKPGECFFAADLLPAGESFDEQVHGHWSRQVGPDPLVTFIVRG